MKSLFLNYKILLILPALLLTKFSYSNEIIKLPRTSFEIRVENAMDKAQNAILNPEAILKRYRPAGMKVSNKVVKGNHVEFLATKTVMMMTKSVMLRASLDISEVASKVSTQNQHCYAALLDLTGSDEFILDNVENLNVLFCLTEKNSGYLTADAYPQMTKGYQNNPIVGKIVKDMIIAQINPVIAAIKEEIELKK